MMEELGKVQSGVSTVQDMIDILNQVSDKTLPVKFGKAIFGDGPGGEWRRIMVGPTSNLTYGRNNPDDIAVNIEEWLPPGATTGYAY